MKKNYYISTFFWSTLQKILSAVVGFISVPLLIRFYGETDYGILSIATACNGYMHLLDLGMNVGAVRFFSQWNATGQQDRTFTVARTNMTFYGIIALINTAALVAIALFGQGLFSVTPEQFTQLRTCLLILATFSLLSWGSTTFSQLLTANKRLDFTMQVQTVMTILRGALIYVALTAQLSLSAYFFWLTLITAAVIVPYAYKCLREGYIDSLHPAAHWDEFRVVLNYCLAIFALSLFQVTATQSRPIILSMFADSGATAAAEFRIIEVAPNFIIMLGGTFSGIFLPKTSEMVAKNDAAALSSFAYKWTRLTTIIVCTISFPFIIGAEDFLSAYVGPGYAYLSQWLALWCVTVLIQMHTTPGNSIVLAYGRTRELVVVTAVDCLVSMAANALMCQHLQVGSAVVAYFFYVVVIIGLYYLYFYKHLLHLDRLKMVKSFALPTLCAIASAAAARYIPLPLETYLDGRMLYIALFALRAAMWAVLFAALLLTFRLVNLREFKK